MRFPHGCGAVGQVRLLAALACLAACLLSAGVAAQEPGAAELRPVANLAAHDVPDDDGSAVYLTWSRMPYDDVEGVEYQVELARSRSGPFALVERFGANTHFKSDKSLPFWMWRPDKNTHYIEVSTLPAAEAAEKPVGKASAEKPASEGAAAEARRLHSGTPYYLRVVAVHGEQRAVSDPVEAVAKGNWFQWSRLSNLFYMLLFSGVLFAFLEFAKRRELFLRVIPGLAAIDEAIGRATEMGRRVLYMTGRHDVDRPSTIAACLILGNIAKRTATYDVRLDVPHTYSVTMAICREITKEAYVEAGRPDAYRDEINYYITEEQFSYAAAVNGDMLRNPPGAVIYMGYYYAESLLMAEAAVDTGAIQVAGTDSETQLPFFMVTCDYTLIGEELYAASAYLSRKPELVGALRGQDVAKAVIMAALVLGVAAVTVCSLAGWERTAGILMDLVRVFS